MDIKELDKKQLILLTLLITFVVSIATGIVTVSLMNQMPKSVPQVINNVIQRTIEKVKTVEVPVINENIKSIGSSNSMDVNESSVDVLIPIYLKNKDSNLSLNENISSYDKKDESNSIGQGVIISDVGLILVESSILKEGEIIYKVVLEGVDFDASLIKKYDNGFSILKISQIKIEDNNTEIPDSTTGENSI